MYRCYSCDAPAESDCQCTGVFQLNDRPTSSNDSDRVLTNACSSKINVSSGEDAFIEEMESVSA